MIVAIVFNADAWVDAPPFGRTARSPGAVSVRQASYSAPDQLRLRVAKAPGQ